MHGRWQITAHTPCLLESSLRVIVVTVQSNHSSELQYRDKTMAYSVSAIYKKPTTAISARAETAKTLMRNLGGETTISWQTQAEAV